MNAMTILKALSEIDPSDIAGAAEAGKGGVPVQEISDAESKGHGTVILQTAKAEPSSGRYLRIGGWTAVAACLMLVIGGVMFFGHHEGDLVLTQSASEQIAEITGITTAGTTVYTEQVLSEEYHPASNVTTVYIDTAEPQTNTAADENSSEQQTEPTAEETKTETDATTTTAVTYPAEIPVLVAMADEPGSILHTDGTPYGLGEAELTQLTGAEAVQNYLNSSAPVVTLGEGQKDAATAAAIMQNPAIYRIRWQMGSPEWSSYGIQAAETDADGVLHLHIAMYSDGRPTLQQEWIYETALLYEAGTMPQITDVKLELTYFSDTDGIEQWLNYNAALAEDVYIRNLS